MAARCACFLRHCCIVHTFRGTCVHSGKISLVSIAEILYWFSLRLCKNFWSIPGMICFIIVQKTTIQCSMFYVIVSGVIYSADFFFCLLLVFDGQGNYCGPIMHFLNDKITFNRHYFTLAGRLVCFRQSSSCQNHLKLHLWLQNYVSSMYYVFSQLYYVHCR